MNTPDGGGGSGAGGNTGAGGGTGTGGSSGAGGNSGVVDAATVARDAARADGASTGTGAMDASGGRPWSGRSGTMTIAESAEFDLGNGKLTWSISGGQLGYFYAGESFNVAVANIKSPGDCRNDAPGGPYPGYAALASAEALRDVGRLSFGFPPVPGPNGILFGTRQSNCYRGLLVIKQRERYAVLDFLSVDARNALTLKYWAGDDGVTDFFAVTR
jgi:hypothetical protein